MDVFAIASYACFPPPIFGMTTSSTTIAIFFVPSEIINRLSTVWTHVSLNTLVVSLISEGLGRRAG